jgi:hypothetical protein
MRARRNGPWEDNPGGDLRSHAVTSAVSSALRGLTSVFGMGTGVTPAVKPPGKLKAGSWKLEVEEKPRSKTSSRGNRRKRAKTARSTRDALGKFYGQAERPISTGKLNALLRLHPPPIKVVVFDRPSDPSACASGLGDLILGWASRLDAFSGYPFRTSLPSYAPGGTARSQEVRPSRSSRTRDGSPQVSCAHIR